MFCHQCGQKLPEEANFCFKCGTATFTDVPAETIEETTPKSQTVARQTFIGEVLTTPEDDERSKIKGKVPHSTLEPPKGAEKNAGSGFKIEEPFWLNETALCEKCGTRFRLQREAEGKVQFIDKTFTRAVYIDGERFGENTVTMRYRVKCPKCAEEIIFKIYLT